MMAMMMMMMMVEVRMWMIMVTMIVRMIMMMTDVYYYDTKGLIRFLTYAYNSRDCHKNFQNQIKP